MIDLSDHRRQEKFWKNLRKISKDFSAARRLVSSPLYGK